MAKAETKAKTIFFDLDGPILDVSGRYFAVHKMICRELGAKVSGGVREYWRQKRRKSSIAEILDTDDKALVERYKKVWLLNIEKKDNFKKDRIFPFARKVLGALAEKYVLVLVTLRRKKSVLVNELKKFALEKYFREVCVVFDEKMEYHVSKYNAVKKSRYFNGKAVFVGDTEVDIKAAKMLGLKSIGVASGIRNRTMLKTFNPDVIVRDIRSLEKILR